MRTIQSVKYRFNLQNAQLARQGLQRLVNKQYLDRDGIVKRVKYIIISPAEKEQRHAYLKEYNLLVEHDTILQKYDTNSYAILILMEAPNLHVDRYTIEEFEKEFGISPAVMQMIIGIQETKNEN